MKNCLASLGYCGLIIVFSFITQGIVSSHAAFPGASWPTSTPESYQMDAQLLHEAKLDVETHIPGAQSLLVIKNGTIVVEHYFNGATADDPSEIYSFTKTVSGTLLGHLVQKGQVHSIDDKLEDYLPTVFKEGSTHQLGSITFRHLLTMTSGIKWEPDQFHLLYPRLCGIKTIFHAPLAHEPGSYFNYDDANAHLLSYVVENVSGLKSSEFAKKVLFDPLEISNFSWFESPDGKPFGGFGLSLTTRDLAKLGYLYLMGGKWKTEQILPMSFVKEATQAQNSGGFPGNTSYGFFWWNSKEKGVEFYYGLGLGGQLLVVVPELDLVAVLRIKTQSFTDDINQTKYIIHKFLLPSVLATTS